MQISFPYPEMNPLDVPDKSLLGIFSPSVMTVEKSDEEVIDEAFSNPIGSVRLRQLLGGQESILVVVDDYTRTTPVQKILHRLIKELQEAGIAYAAKRVISEKD